MASPLSNNRVEKNGSKTLKDVELGNEKCGLIKWVEQFI